ncbi:hypothetical protein CJ030_MR8G025874 [Morella rubra]|uniref:Terpene synthase metal-binding domain-containing protein n=1 Tax=Morella rubra TaxID=262757 RepID=A0A6A1UVR8_9ROSI|nr:hypothetical protein CJ030_MR8G025874 [Morella rubra]
MRLRQIGKEREKPKASNEYNQRTLRLIGFVQTEDGELVKKEVTTSQEILEEEEVEEEAEEGDPDKVEPVIEDSSDGDVLNNQYGAEDDVWIGKTLYRMPYVNNNTYLELAKQDYNNCQASHLMEWDSIQKWYSERNLEDLGLSRRTLLFAYFLAAASIFESERSNERIAWVKTAALIEAITSHFQEKESRRAFLFEFRNHSSNRRNYINGRTSNANQTVQELVRTLLETLNHLSLEAIISNGQDISHHLRQAWEKWMLKWQSEGDRHQGKAELLAHIINLTACSSVPKELLSHPQYKRLSDLLNRVYYKLCSHQRHKVHDNGNHTSHANSITSPEIESGMQELVKLVLHNSSDDIDSDIKQTFLALAKSFYYAAYCDHGTINLHIAKVLFERVV